MAEQKIRDEMDIDVNEFIIITKPDSNTEETMDIEAEEVLINQNIELNDNENNDTVLIEGNHLDFEDNLNSSKEIVSDFYEPAECEIVDDPQANQEWSNEEYSVSQCENDEETVDETIEKNESTTDAIDNDENSDEETIATFITSCGQQLALYAVEDSEEVFAVAVYSESGEPPTNFQFLMKADVERLIGEGAVRTVKKPHQMKKQTYQGELITPQDKEIYHKSLKNSSKMSRNYKNIRQQNSPPDTMLNEHFIVSEDILQEETVEDVDVDIDEKGYIDINDDLTYQDILNSSYFLLEHETIKEANMKLYNDNNRMQEQVMIRQKDDEITEQSTVQYILCGEDQSDSELTFDEIEKSLEHHDRKKKTKSLLKISSRDDIINPEKANGIMNNSSSNQGIKSLQVPLKAISEKPARRILQASSVAKHKYAPNALLGRKNVESKQTVFIQGSTALICCPISDIEESMESSFKKTPESSYKIKRPRKQQLTIVNRADSEIIIQPASVVSEDEKEPVTKKRGRRKKRRQENFKTTIKTRGHFSRKLSNEQRSRIEVIEIDVETDGGNVDDEDEDEDEDAYERRRNNITEIITIEDGKEKDSSDKENEVIMVGDSDDDDECNDTKDEDEEATVELRKNKSAPILKCDHCNRSFRQQRALDTHSRVCPKSPNTRRRITSSSRSSSTKSNESTRSMLKKQYVCKICQEKFDVVVALARHVRSHYKKKETVASVAGTGQKKKQDVIDTNKIAVSSSVISHENPKKEQLTIERKNRERLNLHRGWKSKKMNCIDCGRWFDSAALLSAHCLQHATKKSEKRIKRCQICRKLFRSRLIYIRHMRNHSNAKQLQKRIKRTRQSTSTITTLRKRGRPRKL